MDQLPMTEEQELEQLEAELAALEEQARIEVQLLADATEPPVAEVILVEPKPKKPKKQPKAKPVEVLEPAKVKSTPDKVLFGAAKLKAKFLRR